MDVSRLLVIARLLFAGVCLTATSGYAADSGHRPPTAVILSSDFSDPSDLPNSWETLNGSWRAEGETYDSAIAAPTAITTIYYYPAVGPAMPADVSVVFADFTYHARMLNHGADANDLVGVVYDYDHNTGSYSEALFSPTGTAWLRHVSNGVEEVLASGSYQGGGQNLWMSIALTVTDRSNVSLVVNGLTVFSDVPHPSGTGGRIGLVTHGTTARFDDVSLTIPWGDQPFKEDFSDQPEGWQSSENWTVAGGTYNSTAVVQTSATRLPIGIGFSPESWSGYMLRAKMFNPYGASGNLVGLRFHISDPGYAEVVFSPTGVAKLNVFSEGKLRTVATTSYPGQRNTWFDVRLLTGLGSSATVAVNDEIIFDNVDIGPVMEGGAALVTHWAPGKFDDVWFQEYGAWARGAADFSEPLSNDWVKSGTWNTAGGTLNNTSVSTADIVNIPLGTSSDYIYRARLLNQYGASGNLVGLLFDYVSPREYCEVVFSPTGIARVNTVINGMRQLVATASHSVPRNTWFDVEVIRSRPWTTVKLNGVTIFDQLLQGQIDGGSIGVVSHWSRARFDDIHLSEPPRL